MLRRSLTAVALVVTDGEGGSVDGFAGVGRFGTARRAGSITTGVLTCGGCDAVLSPGGEFDVLLAQAFHDRSAASGRFRSLARRRRWDSADGVPRRSAQRLSGHRGAGHALRRTRIRLRTHQQQWCRGVRRATHDWFRLALQNAPGTIVGSLGLQKVMIAQGESVLGLTLLMGR